MEHFAIRVYGRTEFALLYFPHCTPQVAYRKLQYCIDIYPGLRQQLEAKGCSRKCRMYLPVHIQLIVEAIGEP